MASEFPIPKKEDAFPMGEPKEEKSVDEEPKSTGKLFKAFEADGVSAVFSTVETDENGEFVARLTEDELRDYAEGVLSGEPDTRSLQVSDTFNDIAQAEDKAAEYNDKFKPDDEGNDEECAECVVKAMGDSLGVGEPMTELPEKLPEEMPELPKKGEKIGRKPPEFGEKGVEDEPMLGQFM